MIIAVTLEKETNKVFGHFGEAKYFYLYDTEKKVGKIVDNSGYTHHELIGYIKSLNAEVLICGGMGNHAYEALTASNIKVFPGAKGDVMDVINKYLNNKLIVDLSKLHQCSHNH
jgi:predicted Fe-Mo cluster-binding NifX family protein